MLVRMSDTELLKDRIAERDQVKLQFIGWLNSIGENSIEIRAYADLQHYVPKLDKFQNEIKRLNKEIADLKS
jgi:hypothetical protein